MTEEDKKQRELLDRLIASIKKSQALLENISRANKIITRCLEIGLKA